MADLAVAWPLQNPNVASVICGITQEKYIEANAAVSYFYFLVFNMIIIL